MTGAQNTPTTSGYNFQFDVVTYLQCSSDERSFIFAVAMLHLY